MGEQDQDLVAERQETIRTHTPAQLSEIHSLADVPIPSFIQNLTASKKNVAEPTIEKPKIDTEDKEKGSFKIYDTLPASLTETKLTTKESKVATVPHVNLEVVAGGNKNNEMENVELVHLQRSLSEKSFKSNSSEKNSAKEKKKIKEEEKEKERLAKQEEKRQRKEEKKMEETAKAEK